MSNDNRTTETKRTYGERLDAPRIEPRVLDAPYGASRENGPYSPYGGTVGSPDTHIGGTQPIPIRKGLFEGISVAQVIAASAAAATSMLLASRIGIAGSVIGAAVSSMVTVICSQLYRNALDASARRLKAKQIDHALEQDALKGYAAAPNIAGSGDASGADTPRIRIAPTKLQARAAAERSASRRKVAVFSALIALAAVAASAGLIMLTTAGQGLGTKTPGIFASKPIDTDSTPVADGTAEPTVDSAGGADADGNAAQGEANAPTENTGTDAPVDGTGAQDGSSPNDSGPSDGSAQQDGATDAGNSGQSDASGPGEAVAGTPEKKPAASSGAAA